MKKITLLGVFLLSFAGFAQTNKQKIQSYFEANREKFALTTQDISDLEIRNEVFGKGTKLTSCYVVQRYNGTEVYQAESNVAIKNGEIFKVTNGFTGNVAARVNALNPTLTVLQAAASAYNKMGFLVSPNFTEVERKSSKSFILNDGLQEDNMLAKLVYQPVNNQLMLAWSFEFYAPKSNQLWTVAIDAIDGKILAKYDMTLRCSFGNKDHKNHNHGSRGFNFTNKVLATQSNMLQVQGGTYRVLPYSTESPNHGSFQLISNPENALASPNGWHNASNTIGGTVATQMFTYTRGNNVLAQEDADGNNGNGLRAEGGATLNFDFPYLGEFQQPTEYTNAALTNLFYVTNVIHDVWFQYGFDAPSGNFQAQNYGMGGVQSGTGDYLLADGQDGYSQTTATLNNANFSSPTDGVRPRVQMYLWTLGAPPTEYIHINSPAAIAGPRVATTNVFEGTDRTVVPAAPNGITADLILYTNATNNGTTTPGNPITVNNACIPPSNAFDIDGKIALIRRGNCNFSNKVKNAQDAGALAVIVYDTVPNNPTRLSMSSTGILGITIPAVFVTKEIGEEMVAAMATQTVNVKLETPADFYLYADGDFDNVIIGHEYGHGISNRLIAGGGANCMNNYEQTGEGTSDWFGLILQMKTGDQGTDAKTIGTYVYNEDPTFGTGLREFPYSTDMSIDPRTYGDTNTPNPDPTNPQDTAYRYVVGEFWASVMWDLTWAFVDQYGFDPNIYTGTGGNNKFMQLAIDALKLEACNQNSPVNFRDNLFAADQAANGGANYDMMAAVFTRRGLGLNASAGSVNDVTDQVEDFTPFPTMATQSFANTADVRVYPNPSTGVVNVRIANFNGNANFQVVDINGRVVFSQTEDNFASEKTLNLGKLQTGVYILKVNTAEFSYSNKIIIK